MGAASFRQREPRRVDIDLEIMVAHLILVPITADVIGNVCPRSEAVYFGALEQQQFLVGAPVRVEYWERVLLDDSEGMGCGLVVVACRAARETLYTEIVIIACRMCTPNPDLETKC